MAGTPAAAEHDDFTQWRKSVEDRLRAALGRGATRPQLSLDTGNFVINGGLMQVVGEGGFSMLASNGVEVFSARGRTDLPAPDGSAQPQVRIYRANGTAAFYMWDPFPDFDGYQQFWAWYDNEGHIIVGDDITSGRGLARPYMHYDIRDENGTDYVTLTSTASFATAHTIAGRVQNPRVELAVTATAPGTGPGEVQVIFTGTGEVLAGPTSIPAGTSVSPFYQFNVPVSADLYTYQYFEVQTRRVSGTGNVQSRVWSAYGIQS